MDALVDHLWQSTWFAAGAALLAFVLRREPARVQYWIWLAASLKFLVPFSWLASLGGRIVWQTEDESGLLPLVQEVAGPLADLTVAVAPMSASSLRVMEGIWLLGSAALLLRWISGWLRARALVRASIPCHLDAPLAVRCTTEAMGPGLIGITNPVLLIPARLLSELSPAQIDAIVAHELSHARRRDNLMAALHSAVEIVFWFHPLVWCIGARLIEARERACDEGALHAGCEPKAYAEALLNVCRHSVASPSIVASSATAGDLAGRVRAIMSYRGAADVNLAKRALLVMALASCVAIPVASGVVLMPTSRMTPPAGTMVIQVSEQRAPTFIAARDDFVYARNVSLRELISHAYAVDGADVRGDVRWLDNKRYDVELRAPKGADIEYKQLIVELLAQQFNLQILVGRQCEAPCGRSGLRSAPIQTQVR